MAKKKTSPPDLLRTKGHAVDVAVELGISRFQLYGLLSPGRYPVPPAVFDTRSDFAERLGDYVGLSATEIRNFYDKAVAA